MLIAIGMCIVVLMIVLTQQANRWRRQYPYNNININIEEMTGGKNAACGDK